MAPRKRRSPAALPVRVPEPSPRLAHALGALALVGVLVLSSVIRIGVAVRDPHVDMSSPRGMLRTDPALLYYITERIVESGGLPPADFRADPRLEYPDTTDVPALETVGQEFAVAWAYLLLGGGGPLHAFCIYAMGAFASLAAVGAFGLALELTGRVRWAVLAALLWAVLLPNYRTTGFVLVREDFSLPWFALHLYLLARAARVRTATSCVLAALAGVAAVATWHAMTFVVAVEAACLLLWFARSGQNALAARHAWIFPATAAIASAIVPVLRAKQFVLSLPMQIAWALLGAGHAARRFGLSRRGELGLALGLGLGLLAAARLLAAWTGAGLADYAHVVELMVAKLSHLGNLPDDPEQLSFGARLLWQGPFETANPRDYALNLGSALVAIIVAAALAGPGWIRGRGDARFLLLSLFGVASAVGAYLIDRLQVLPGLVAPVLAAVILDRLRRPRLGVALMVAAIAGQAAFAYWILRDHRITWYLYPERIAELAHLVDWIEVHVPEGEPVASDFVTSAAILAHTRRPILQQPKFETVRSRERVEELFSPLFQGTPRELRAALERRRCRTLVIDRPFLITNRYMGGVAPTRAVFDPRTAAALFLSPDPAVYGSIPGFRLVYRSPPELRFESYRVYRLE